MYIWGQILTLGKQTATTNELFTFPKVLPFLVINIALINFFELHFQNSRHQAPEDEIQQPNYTQPESGSKSQEFLKDTNNI